MADLKNAIRCTACNKVIGVLDYLNDGKLTIKCKCGVVNTIAAEPDQRATKNFIYNAPYQHKKG